MQGLGMGGRAGDMIQGLRMGGRTGDVIQGLQLEVCRVRRKDIVEH